MEVVIEKIFTPAGAGAVAVIATLVKSVAWLTGIRNEVDNHTLQLKEISENVSKIFDAIIENKLK